MLAPSSTKIFSESGMNIVGSAGTMVQFEGRPANTTDENGVKHIRLYATKSVSKNKPFEEAINNDNFELIVNEMLDPVNEHFLAKILSNRPQLVGTSYDNGHTVFSKDAIGTFIDGIASFDEVVNMILSDKNIGVNKNQNNNSNSNKMTKEEIKSQFPAVYSEILSEGVAQEREQVASWNAFKDVDSKAVEAGIASGLPIKQSEINAFIVKATNKGKVADLLSDNAKGFSTEETAIVDNSESVAKQAEIKAAFDF